MLRQPLELIWHDSHTPLVEPYDPAGHKVQLDAPASKYAWRLGAGLQSSITLWQEIISAECSLFEYSLAGTCAKNTHFFRIRTEGRSSLQKKLDTHTMSIQHKSFGTLRIVHWTFYLDIKQVNYSWSAATPTLLCLFSKASIEGTICTSDSAESHESHAGRITA
jgi:hypothetical protein